MKKILSILCAVVLLFSLAACASGEPMDLTGYDYTKTSDKEFQFKTFNGVSSKMRIYNANDTSYYVKELTDEEFDAYYKDLADAGFTVATQPYFPEGTEHNLRMLDAAQKYGMKQILGEMIGEDGVSLSFMLQGRYTDPNGRPYADYTDEEVVARCKEFFEPYMDHPAFLGFSLWDEPLYNNFENVARALRLFNQACPGKLLYVNLLPVSIARENLGITDDMTKEEYASSFLEMVEMPYVSYDFYAIRRDQNGERTTAEEFLYNMQVFKREAQKKDIPLWTYLLSTEHTFSDNDYPQLTNVADVRWQVYSFMAFGGEGVSWFTTFPAVPEDSYGGKFGAGLWDRKGRKTQNYYYVSKVQNEVAAWDEVYLNFDWKGVYTQVGMENKDGFNNAFDYLNDGADRFTEVEAFSSFETSQDTLVGCFADPDGQAGYIFVNYADPALLATDRVEVVFKDAAAAVVYRKGVKSIVPLYGGKLTMNMTPGEGVFVIPLAEK